MNLLENINQVLTLSDAFKKDGRKLNKEDVSIIDNACIIYDKTIQYVGNINHAPENLLSSIKNRKNLSGHVVTPEIVDSHTHLIFGGNRSKEYTMRLNGADYQELAAAGGGILSSTTGTNTASDEDLLQVCSERIERIFSYGIGTIEIKSGYGLGYDEEYRLTKMIDKLKSKYSPKINIINTYMAAHAVPNTSKSSSEYIHSVCIPLMKKLNGEGVIDIVDIFHEEGYFNEQDVRDLFRASIELGLPVKSHADEFKDNKGAILACEFSALSTDHLLCTTDDGIKALSESKTIATLLPGTGYFLGKNQADARSFLDNGVKVAIASDFNPGSCHCDNLLLIASLVAPEYKLNQAELWSSITLNASHALGIKTQGAIVKGLRPRFTIFKANIIDEVTYNWGRNLSVSLESI